MARSPKKARSRTKAKGRTTAKGRRPAGGRAQVKRRAAARRRPPAKARGKARVRASAKLPTIGKNDPRYIAPTSRYFIHGRDVVPEAITKVEDVIVESRVAPMVKVAIVTDKFLCTEVRRVKGHIDPVHRHMDHESINYLVSGRMRLVIGGKEFIAEPGAYWVHPMGVDHFAEILEDSVNLELKIPPTKTWNHP